MTEDNVLKQLLKGAVIEHLRHWWGYDSLWYQTLGQNVSGNSDEFRASTLRQMAIGYYVSRGIHGGEEKAVLELLNSRIPDWPEKLEERAEFVRCTAKEANTLGLTDGVQLSGFSKLFWFVKPHCWTMFDKYVDKGLGAKYRKVDHFGSYYKKLDELHFGAVMEKGRKAIGQSDFPYLWPERVLDKYLMLCGQVTKDSEGGPIREQEHVYLIKLWSEFYDSDVENKVDSLVDAFFKAVSEEPVFHCHI